MQDVRLHLSGSGQVWAMTKCKVCGDIDKFLIAQARTTPVPCKKCGRHMDIRNATIEAVETQPAANGASPQPSGDPII